MHGKTGGGRKATFSDIDVVSQGDVAKMFVERYDGVFAFDHTHGKWYRWTGKLWEPDETRLANHYAIELCRQYSLDLAVTQKRDCRRLGFALGVLGIAEVHPYLSVTADRWDSDPFLLGTPDGTVDLRTGELRHPLPEDRITKSVAVVPAENADCPKWLAFLEEAFEANAAQIRFIQQWLGYSLTGSTREQKFVFLYGPGGNGKGTLLGTASAIAGNYFKEAPIEAFLHSSRDRHPTELAMLAGARMVTATETDQGRIWNEQRLKAVTGGDVITARFMRENFFEFRPQLSLTIQGNHMPELRAVDDAMRRRLILLPMTHKPATANLSLADELITERPAILRWIIDGCLDWQQNGLVVPDDISIATDDYLEEQDMFAAWAEECCDFEPGNTWFYDTASRLFESWMAYAKRNGLQPGTVKSFSAELGRRGFPQARKNKERRRIGIQLKEPDDARFGDG